MVDRSRVALHPLAEEDVADILGWVNDPAVVGNIAAFSGAPLTHEQELAYVRQMLASEADRVWSVRADDDARYLGQVGLHQIHWRSRVGRLACIIGKRAEMGKGFGSAAIARALDVAFAPEAESGLALHKVWLMIFATNTRSRRTYARLGFVEEGTLREEYFHEGGWKNMLRMSLLDREWPRAPLGEATP